MTFNYSYDLKDSAVPLQDKFWLDITRFILEKEDMGRVKVFLEPSSGLAFEDTGPFDLWINKLWNKFLQFFQPERRLLGWYTYGIAELHFTIGGSPKQVFNTILHEIAHGRAGLEVEEHGPYFNQEFANLQDRWQAVIEVDTNMQKGVFILEQHLDGKVYKTYHVIPQVVIDKLKSVVFRASSNAFPTYEEAERESQASPAKQG